MTRIAMLVAVALIGPAEVQQGDVRIRANVRSSVFTWQVTNLGDEPIVRFEIPQHNGYNFLGPEHWEVEGDARTFRAWTVDPIYAIRPGQTCTFSQRVSSRGAVLGLVQARVGFTNGGWLTLAGVWGVAPEPLGTLILVPLALAAIVILHTLLLSRRDRRELRAGLSGAVHPPALDSGPR